MAEASETDLKQLYNAIKKALNREKSSFQRNISSGQKLKMLDDTFLELNKVAEAVVGAKFGPLRQRPKFELTHVYPMLERQMIRVRNSIDRRLSPRMSKIHPWKIYFDVAMPREVFSLLYKGIISRTRYGIEVVENVKSVTITFTVLRRLCHLFDIFEDCQEFVKQLGDGKGCVKLIVSDQKKGTLKYKFKEEMLTVDLCYGFWNAFGIRQHRD